MQIFEEIHDYDLLEIVRKQAYIWTYKIKRSFPI